MEINYTDATTNFASMMQILGWQMIGMVAIALWTAVLSGLMFGMLRCFGILRVRDEVQKEGEVTFTSAVH